jgi:sulfhydrogenase subunit beta (sulfur reductase)
MRDAEMNVITRKKLNDWLDHLAQKGTVVAPVKLKGKYVYRQVKTGDEVAWDFERTDMPPKTALYPMSEVILHIEQGEKTNLKQPDKPGEVILFGVRPCDARSFTVLDALFLAKPPADPIYENHRRAFTTIGLACPQMWDSCFCTVVGRAPDGTEGLDVLLTEIADGYAVQALTEKGKTLTADLGTEDREGKPPKPKIKENLPALQKTSVWGQLFHEALWETLSNTCISCRTCSFVCPTCRCFDVRDELTMMKPGYKEFDRIRAWDTCTAAAYRRAAGGHNPRDTREKRLRNRFYCKLMYYPDVFGALGCVGCGRCIDACPAGIDILEAIRKVDELAAKQPARV